MTAFSKKYTELYDLVHKDKNYFSEVSQLVLLMIKCGITRKSNILDFGCGTGRHLNALSKKGFEFLTGYDVNPNMIDVARINNDKLPIYSDISKIETKFDFVFSLFDVFSYQITNSDVEKFLSQVVEKCNSDKFGFIDGWYLPGVLRKPPENRNKKIVINNTVLLRKVTVQESESKNITNLKIDILHDSNKEIILSEQHKLRAYTKKELVSLITAKGGTDLIFMDGSNYELPLDDNSWRFALMFKNGCQYGV